jgi:hypothetical protein
MQFPLNFFGPRKMQHGFPGTAHMKWEIEVQYGQIKDVESVVIAAIAFNETDVVGCDAQRMNITVVK